MIVRKFYALTILSSIEISAPETDFVVSKGNNKYYIQSAYSIYDEHKYEQERKSLINIKDSFKKIIITRESLPIRRDEKGIVIMGIIDFLLDDNFLD